MSNETDIAPLEVMPLGALHAMERAQIDAQVATAHAFPRSIEKFRQRSLAMATLDLETAESCIYCRPVGKEKNDRGVWVEKFAEGPSIRLAEIVACCYGNLRAAARIVEQTPRSVKAEGACHDLETNYAGKSDIIESTVNKNGEPYSERQSALTAKVAVAKAYRDAVFRVVPRALCKPAYEAAKKIVSGEGKTIAERVKRVQKWLETRKIEDKRALAVLGITDWSQVTEEHLMTLTGLRTAVQDGDDPADIFPFVQGTTPPHAPAPTGFQQSQQPPAATATSAPAQPTATATAPTTPATPPAEQPTRRGRPPGSKNKPAETGPGITGKFTPEEAAKLRAEGHTVADSAIEQPPQTQPMPQEVTQPATDDAKELAALGLAPEPEPAPATTGAPESPPTTPPPTDKPPFAPKKGEGEALTNVRRLMWEDDVTEDTLMAFLKKFNVSKEGQKLADLATKKHEDIAKGWRATLLPKLKAA